MDKKIVISKPPRIDRTPDETLARFGYIYQQLAPEYNQRNLEHALWHAKHMTEGGELKTRGADPRG